MLGPVAMGKKDSYFQFQTCHYMVGPIHINTERNLQFQIYIYIYIFLWSYIYISSTCCYQKEMYKVLVHVAKPPNEPTAGRQKDYGHGRGLGGAEHGSHDPRRVHWCDLPRMPIEAGNWGLSSSCLFKFCVLDSWLTRYSPYLGLLSFHKQR